MHYAQNSRLRTLAATTFALLLTLFSAIGTIALPAPSNAAAPMRQLTSGASNNMDPVFSPNSRLIALASDRAGSYDIWVMDSDGRRQTRITSLPGDERLPRWRHDSISLAFIWNHEGLTDLCLTAITSPIPECVTSQARVASYSWSPDGKIIAFDDLKTGSVYLYEVSTAAVSLFPFNANVKDPVFGVSSDRLYFAAKTGDDFNIWSAKLDGSSPRRLSWLGSDVKPQVSPRGDRLLYLTDFPGHCEPWLVDVDGKTNQYLLDRPHIIGYSFPPSPPLACGTIPRWSPNGSQTLIISGGSDSAGSLFLVTLDFSVTITPQSGGSEVQPERHYLNIFNRVSLEISVLDVQWSLDGNKVVLVSDDLGSAQIFLLRIGAGTRVGYGT